MKLIGNEQTGQPDTSGKDALEFLDLLRRNDLNPVVSVLPDTDELRGECHFVTLFELHPTPYGQGRTIEVAVHNLIKGLAGRQYLKAKEHSGYIAFSGELPSAYKDPEEGVSGE